MKKDVKLFREILEHEEKLQSGGPPHRVSIEGRTQEEVSFHIRLMADKNLLQIQQDFDTLDDDEPYVIRLTDEGHDALKAFRSNMVLELLKKPVTDATGALTSEGLKSLPDIISRLFQ
jgi:hypothetical protein